MACTSSGFAAVNKCLVFVCIEILSVSLIGDSTAALVLCVPVVLALNAFLYKNR